MNNKQYNNVIEKTAKLSETDMNDSLALMRDTLNKMGVPLPQGELKEVSEILSTNDYMYWRACSAEDAQAFANDGIAAIAVSDSNIAILTAETDNPTTTRTISATETANVSTVSEVSYYAYSSGGTNTTTYPDTTESGDYYCNNKQYGKYLRRLCDVITVSSGTFSELLDSIIWRIEKHEDGYYTIKINGTSKYLSTNGNTVRLTVVSDVIPSDCKWIRSINQYGGGVFFKNACHQKFLACNSSGLTMKTSVGEIGTATYYSCVWRMLDLSFADVNRELTSAFSISDCVVGVGATCSPKINKSPSNAYWADASDFDYTFDSDKIEINSGKITGKKRGHTSVTGTHKITTCSDDFNVFVQNSSHNDNNTASLTNDFEAKYGDEDFGFSLLYDNSSLEALNLVIGYDAIITKYCNQFGIPKEFVQSILFRELWCVNSLDALADSAVMETHAYLKYPNPNGILLYREDCSTGPAQIFAKTAINALNNASDRGFIELDRKYTTAIDDIMEVWSKLHDDDDFNIMCCALVILDCQYEYRDSIPYHSFFDMDVANIKKILSRYNGYGTEAQTYGNETYEYYEIFSQYN